jgi:D-alanyl-D-alanine carboxypeptidase
MHSGSMHTRVVWLVCLASVSAVACGRTTPSLDTALAADLQQYLTTRSAVEHISAASLSVRLHGAPSTINVAVGTAAYGGGAPATPADLFQIGSVTKAETAVIVLQLEAEGKLTLDDTVGRWLPQYPAWRGVTIRRLLNMTSGIPTYDATAAWEHTIGQSPGTVFTTAQLIGYVYPHGTIPTPPASVWLYSNTGYALTERIIDSVTHSDYATQLATRVITPLGLKNTFYYADSAPADVIRRMVSGYYFNHDTTAPGLYPLLGRDVRDASVSWTRAAGGIIATPEDVTVLARSLFDGPLLAPAQRRELMRLVSVKTGQPMGTATEAEPKGFGLGVSELALPAPVGTIWFYEGETLGYRMLYAYFPAQDAVIAVGLNSQPDADQDKIGPLLQTVFMTLHAAGKI